MLLKMMTLALLNTYEETKQQLQGLKMEVNIEFPSKKLYKLMLLH